MSERSDWTRELLDGDAPMMVSVTLEDGSRKLLQVSRVEHERFAAAGTPITGTLERLRAGMRRHGPKAARWILVAVAAAVISAAISTVISTRATTYYADREQENALKVALVTTISRGSVSASDLAFGVVNAAVERHQRGFTAIRQRNRATSAWRLTEAEVDPLVWLHFDGTAAERHWGGYREALFDYFSLSHVDRGVDPADLTSPVQAYLAEYPLRRPIPPPELAPKPFALLNCTRPGCRETKEWRAAYVWLGATLLRERGALSRAFLAADAQRLG